MATTAAANEVWRVLLQGRIEEQQCENVLFFRTHLGDNNVENNLLKAIVECFVLHLVPVMGSTYEFVRAVGTRIVPDVGPDIIVTAADGDAVQGAAAGDTQPSFVSCLVSIASERGGRSGRGRMFLPAVPEASTTGSFINPESAFWLGVVAYIACVIAAFIHSGEFPVANQWEIGVFSRKLGGAKAPFLAAGFAPALRLTPNRALATTRSRKVGHGS